MPRLLTRNRAGRLAVLGLPLPAIIVGALLLLGGVAVAAILLRTTIDGTATVREVRTSNTLAATATSANGSQLNCSDLTVSADVRKLTLNPVLTKPVGGANADGVPVPGGECTINVAVTNTGETTLRLDGSSRLTGPNGWNITAITGTALSPIRPGATATLSATLKADQDAAGGAIGGQLIWTDAAA